MRARLFGLLALLAALPANSGVMMIQPGSATSATFPQLGALSQDGPATPEQIALIIPITGSWDADHDSTANCQYRAASSGSWVTCHPLYRIRTDLVQMGVTVQDAYAWPIIDLEPGTSYVVSVQVCEEGQCETKGLTTSTRALPVCGSVTSTVSSAGGIQAAIAALTPGQTLQIDDGNYTVNSIDIGVEGTSGLPICIRGQSRAGTVLTDTSGELFDLMGLDNVVIENMTLHGSGSDGGTGAGSGAFIQADQNYDSQNVTIREITATGFDRFVYFFADVYGALVYDNTVTGNDLWSASPVDYLNSNLTWNDDGIHVPGAGAAVFNNTMTGFGDTFAIAHSQGGTESQDIFIYRNEVHASTDDPVELDDGIRNIGVYDNRITNTINFISLDGINGGPIVWARNIEINSYRVNKWKFNNTGSGIFILNNTHVHAASIGTNADLAGRYQPFNAFACSYGYQNNLDVYRGAGAYTVFDENGCHDPVDASYNAFYPNRTFDIDDESGPNLAAAVGNFSPRTPVFSGLTGFFSHSVITVNDPFVTDITLGADATTEVTTLYYPVISGGDNAKNAGVAIPNITSVCADPVNPDIGAACGQTPPEFGDRSL